MNTPAAATPTEEITEQKIGLMSLLKQFFPLAISDFAMTIGDTFRTMALVRLANPDIVLAAIGIIKSVAALLESPIIMILHASTALSVNRSAHRALWRITLLLSGLLSSIFLFLCWAPVYHWLFGDIFGADSEVVLAARFGFLLLVPWPAVIGIRRFYQGILIRAGHRNTIAHAGLVRLASTCALLWIGVHFQWEGVFLGAISLMGTVIIESAMVIFLSYHYNSPAHIVFEDEDNLSQHPTTTATVARYYLPLGSTTLLIWTGKAMLVGVIVRAVDGNTGLAAWVAVNGFVAPLCNTTRMVQQIILSVPSSVSAKLLWRFAVMVGLCCSAPLVLLAFSPPGTYLLRLFLDGADNIFGPALPGIQLLALMPLTFALQTFYQGLLLKNAGNWWINGATFVNVALTFILTIILVKFGYGGALSAAIGTLLGQLAEMAILHGRCRKY